VETRKFLSEVVNLPTGYLFTKRKSPHDFRIKKKFIPIDGTVNTSQKSGGDFCFVDFEH
jgi:hypothetical protein